jgi:hypothetical protein
MSNILQLWCIFSILQLEYWEKKLLKKSNNYWMLYKIYFESFDGFMVKCPYYKFLLKERKGMHKMTQLISKFLYKKNMFPFMQLHVYYANLMKKSHKNFKVLKFWSKGLQGEMIPLLNNLANVFVSIRFKISSFRCTSHMQEIIMWKACLVDFKSPFLHFLCFLLQNQNIHAQLCTHVKNHHHHMNYLILDYSIFLTKIYFM